MNLLTHALLGWNVAVLAVDHPRDRALVTGLAVAPDLDGLGLLIDAVSPGILQGEAEWFGRYHHQLGHNLWAGLLFALAAAAVARRRARVLWLGLLQFHLHLVCDLVGSRGPDGHQWPIPYLGPLAPGFELSWAGQWELNAWPNLLITLLAIVGLLAAARNLGVSPLGWISARADAALVATLRQRWPLPPGAAPPAAPSDRPGSDGSARSGG